MAPVSPTFPNGDSLPFTEPHTIALLVVGSFLYLLNVIHELFQLLFGAGLVGQLILGAIYCVPLGNILPIDIQSSIGTIGYWGLLLLIVEDGLGTRLDILTERGNSALCVLVAFTGIRIPIGFSMVVLYFGYQYATLESFIIGAALSVTSLGTTIAIMSSFRFPVAASKTPKNGVIGECRINRATPPEDPSNIGETRAGTILMGAAVIDDIPGLVISSVVANLGPTNAEIHLSAWVIARPITSSIAILLVTAILAKYISPLFVALLPPKSTDRIVEESEKCQNPAPVQQQLQETRGPLESQAHLTKGFPGPTMPDDPECATIFETENRLSETPRKYMHSKWSHQVPNVALLLFIAVTATYVTIANYIGSSRLIGAFCAGSLMSHCWKRVEERTGCNAAWSPHASFNRISPVQNYVLAPFFFASIGAAIPVRSLFEITTAWRGILFSALMVAAKLLAGGWLPIWAALERRFPPRARSAAPEATPSWPAGLLVGFALVTRDEIGLLILNIAKAQGLVHEEGFAVGIWAVVLSTLIGPIGVGTLLRTRAIDWVDHGGFPRANIYCTV